MSFASPDPRPSYMADVVVRALDASYSMIWMQNAVRLKANVIKEQSQRQDQPAPQHHPVLG